MTRTHAPDYTVILHPEAMASVATRQEQRHNEGTCIAGPRLARQFGGLAATDEGARRQRTQACWR